MKYPTLAAAAVALFNLPSLALAQNPLTQEVCASLGGTTNLALGTCTLTAAQAAQAEAMGYSLSSSGPAVQQPLLGGNGVGMGLGIGAALTLMAVLSSGGT